MLETLVVLPTYNECENITPIIRRILASSPHTDVLVVDDNSPDGTGRIADDLAARHPEVHVLHRTEKNGLGGAYLAGFAWGLEAGYWALVEMDADGSHHPEDLPRMIELLADHDLVLGSRWVPGGRTENWPLSRQLLSRGGSMYTRAALGIDVRDATGGFRVFSARALREIDLGGVASQGYCFQVDLLWRALEHGLRVVETPITFTERVFGESKMSGDIVRESLLRVTAWGLRRRARAVRRALTGGSRLTSVRAQYHRVLP
ncbi:polyprenol monophosphomannose synthase [Lacisediminihabitans changchengi]|uniref:Polyprenol monophosphomannose synthase n=1 Tax=Lacisediminihabitans changchengi TaxID=2787634 RepID=A0A934W1L8_9MICO|nr:polyprenol monophosphomannose synthase [Lacisediminihabitans changchengi]MBK4347013.1 polyprenol monophosphomannose synthase [Lacisediminihabitans changchengi]MBK4347864.1 polyprenol monophosphomannose synthase [Lacisediminihabitans changchengi]